MLFAATAASATAAVHPVVGTVASITVVEGPDGRYVEVIVTHDALAYALNDTSTRITDPQMYALLDGPIEDLAATLQDGRERFQSGFKVFADGVSLPLEIVQSPTVESIEQWKFDKPGARLPVILEFIARAQLPANCASIAVQAPAVFDEVVLGVTRPGRESTFMPLAPAELSPDFLLRQPGAAVSAGSPEPDGESTLGVAWRYAVIGYEHIIPMGFDHALFIFGLFLLNARLKDVVWQTTTFTIAHTCTLTLSTLGLVRLPMGLVEPVIALTIAFVAIENLFTTKVHPWRPAVAFVFGLAHGLGFASALQSIGLPASQLAVGIAAFSVGVECGHISILLAAFALIGWWRKKDWYRARISIPLSTLVALIALYWFAQRVL